MTVKIGVVMDPIESISYYKDSTLAMLWAAQRKGWQIFYMEQSSLFLRDGVVQGRMAPLSVAMDPDDWFERGEYSDTPLNELDVILNRVDPPFDNEFLYTTQLLALAERDGVLVTNNTQEIGRAHV